MIKQAWAGPASFKTPPQTGSRTVRTPGSSREQVLCPAPLQCCTWWRPGLRHLLGTSCDSEPLAAAALATCQSISQVSYASQARSDECSSSPVFRSSSMWSCSRLYFGEYRRTWAETGKKEWRSTVRALRVEGLQWLLKTSRMQRIAFPEGGLVCLGLGHRGFWHGFPIGRGQSSYFAFHLSKPNKQTGTADKAQTRSFLKLWAFLVPVHRTRQVATVTATPSPKPSLGSPVGASSSEHMWGGCT